MTPTSISVLGAGWLGQPLAERLAAEGWQVRASTTTLEKLKELEAAGLAPYLVCLEPGPDPRDIGDFFASKVLFVNVPPGLRHGATADYYRAQMDAVAQHAANGGVEWLIYTSSTSVYPDAQGDVAEGDAAPASETGRLLLEVEARFREHSVFDTTVLRLAGLYGGDRHPIYHLEGRTGLANGDAPVNLVHRDDVLRAVQAVLARDLRGGTYNLAADSHPTRRALYTHLAGKLGLTPPSYTDGFGKHVANGAFKEAAAFEYAHPDPASWPD